ncbi:hypothetical protein CTI12_AA209430 [Artemisia annua]|uniref:Uncharacterized protein n=1 Tax=Artemisia annua TaxID=35608 RepID=A0A2U1NZ95_ARTAN|nr:hypothetical protein CTI12_AA209430 [Artemisia annua]
MDILVIDLTPYIDVTSGEFCLDEVPSHEVEKVCLEANRILRETRALHVKDPRFLAEGNEQLISMIEKYFEISDEFKLLQARPDMNYQVKSFLVNAKGTFGMARPKTCWCEFIHIVKNI